MKNFEYFAPGTMEEALELLSRYNERSKVIAGGQSLLIFMRQGLLSPEYLIDIKGISDLAYINFDRKSGLRIGALTTHRAIETSGVIRNGFGVLAETEKKVSSVQTRNWGTIGGNLCHGDPVGDPAPVLIALRGELKVASIRGSRVIAVEEFFKDFFQTALGSDELLVEIEVPNPPPRTGVAYHRFSLVEEDYAIVSAAVSVTLGKGEQCDEVRIVLGGVASVPMRAKGAEKVLKGKEIKGDLLRQAVRQASEEAKPVSDMHASEEYKRELVGVLVHRAVQEALGRAKEA
jgi:carbon-monoxide dehydrogenase medium subunit